jgi:hypothetical protein
LAQSAFFSVRDNVQKPGADRYELEVVTNGHMLNDEGGMTASRVSFVSKEYYDEAKRISVSKAIWKKGQARSFYNFLPQPKESRPATARGQQFDAAPEPWTGDNKNAGSPLYHTQSQVKLKLKSQLKSEAESEAELNAEAKCKAKYKSASKTKIKINNQGEETPLFLGSFKKEDCASLKARLARQDPTTDSYVNPAAHTFRPLQAPDEKPLFKVRIECLRTSCN